MSRILTITTLVLATMAGVLFIAPGSSSSFLRKSLSFVGVTLIDDGDNGDKVGDNGDKWLSPLSPTLSPGQNAVTSNVTIVTKDNSNTGLSSRNTGSDKQPIGDTVTMTPRVIVTVSPTASLSPSLSPRLSPSLSPSPSQSVSPSKSPTPTPKKTPTPTPSSVPTQTPTPTPDYPGSGVLVVSEIGWMGTSSSFSDEWVELFNPGSSVINLEGWVLKSETDGSPSMNLSGMIQPGGYYLVERTNDSVISDITADLVASFGKGGLTNTGEVLLLLDPLVRIQDRAGVSGAWPAGDNGTKASMERVDPALPGDQASSWKTFSGSGGKGVDASGNPILGTPRVSNS